MENIYIGQILKVENEDAICLRLLDRPSVIISKKFLGNYKIGDFIICELTEVKKRTFLRKLHTFRDNQVGEIIFENENPVILFTYKKDKQIKIPCTYFSNFYEGAKVRFRLGFSGNELKAIVYQILGDKENRKIDIMDIAEQHEIPTVFRKNALKQASFIHEPKEEITERVDLRNELIFTIDGTYSKDFDDAVSLKMDGQDYLLGVHIADVEYYIKEGSPLDLEAQKRGMTAYLLDSVFPMFPEKISNGVCSLKEGVDRYTLSVEMRISKEGIIQDVHCFPAVIRSKKRMTYEQVNQVLEGKLVDGYENFSDTLFSMNALAHVLYKARIANGAIDFDSHEPQIILDEDGYVINIKMREKGQAELLIQEFMLAANRSIAELLYRANIVFPHRVHKAPDEVQYKIVGKKLKSIDVSIKPLSLVEEKKRSFVFQEILEKYRISPNYSVISNLLISCMRRAKYSIEEAGHFGLGLERNVHFTSPIRRYPDLMIHRIVKHNYLYGMPQTAAEIENMKIITEYITKAEARINRCEERVIRLKCREYLQDHIGETIDAVVTDCTEKGILIELKNCIEAMILKEDLQEGIYDDKRCRYTFLNKDFCCKIGTPLKVKLVPNPTYLDKVSFKIMNEGWNHSYTLNKHNLY